MSQRSVLALGAGYPCAGIDASSEAIDIHASSQAEPQAALMVAMVALSLIDVN